MTESEHPKVFISYSHQDAKYETTILTFANRLRSEGIDATVDLYEDSPAEGWQRWAEKQIDESDYVLIVNCQSYYEKCTLNKGKGVIWEAKIIYQHLYDSYSNNEKFIPVLFDQKDEQYILTPLKPFTHYNVGSNDGFDKLYWRLRGISRNQKPPLGKLRSLEKKEPKTLFFSTPIDLEKWNEAGWKGMLYLIEPGHAPVLGLIFNNFSAAKSIFSEWKKTARNITVDKFLKVSYIIPPFPDKCWVYSDGRRSFGKGYFVHIGPNVEESLSRATEIGIAPEDLLLTSIGRCQWMDEPNGSQNRDLFQTMVNVGTGYSLIPVGIRDEDKPLVISNLVFGYDLAVPMKNCAFKIGRELEENDVCRAVLQKPENSK